MPEPGPERNPKLTLLRICSHDCTGGAPAITAYTAYLVQGNLCAKLGSPMAILRGQADWSAAALEVTHRAYADSCAWSTKELFMTVRVAVTGRTASPPLFETMAVLGALRCRDRLEDAVAYLQAL